MRPAVLVLLATLLSWSTVSLSETKAPYESDPKFIAAFAEAKQLQHKRDYLFAREAYLKADKISGDTCVDCLESLFDLNLAFQKYKEAQANASRLTELASTPADKSIAEAKRARAILLQAGDKAKPAQLEAAHAVLQTALTDYPRNLSARWDDACLLVAWDNSIRLQMSSAPALPQQVPRTRCAFAPATSLKIPLCRLPRWLLDSKSRPAMDLASTLTIWAGALCSSTSGPRGAGPATLNFRT